MAQVLYQPDVYARIDLRIQTQFKSSYALALYENCIRFHRIGATGWISIDQFRKLMGVGDDKYNKFNDFNRRVLSPALVEINKVSDIEVQPTLRRMSQKVIALKFQIKLKQKKVRALGVPGAKLINTVVESANGGLRAVLESEFKASRQDATKIVSSYPEAYIQEKIKIIQSSQIYKTGGVNSPIALLKSALRENYSGSTNQSTGEVDSPKKRTSHDEKDAYETYFVTASMKGFNALDLNIRKDVERGFAEKLEA
ncbi:unnamed protein product, partial [marine sediment metagenome]